MTTIGDWLKSVADLPRLDCELLLGHFLQLSRAQVLAFPETRISADRLTELQAGAASLRGGTPVAYILGEWEFWGLRLNVTPAVLIPRPETELLVELTVAHAPGAARVLDLGTGSGAVATALGTERSDLRLAASDISQDALAVAAANAARHGVNVSWRLSNWFDGFAPSERWDVIVSNPPYIAEGDPHLPALKAEPRQALVAGHDGLRDLRHICQAAVRHLNTGGYLIVEHGYDQAAEVRRCLGRAGFTAVQSRQDLAGIDRATLGHI